ncbi:MAG: hypothetical protein CL528_12185 [Aequorivita sp.]|nr:hypothetical protein [Aequorivita sp.]MBP42529.1 hypothetical protein [Aequorivita sp.]|tara:strand:- start:3010 stop:4173 length:1164 start_codon:yes stop_codon:yes gene_type:complete
MEISREILTRVTILDISLILMYIIGIVALAQKFRDVSVKFVRLFALVGITHLFFTFVYYFYTLNNVADSIGYYRRVLFLFDNWGETFGQGTTFIYFTLYPLVKFLGLTYFGSFFVYSFFGLLGYYYLLKILIGISNVKFTKWFYLLLLPNIHFWSVAIGKDSLIFFGISFLAYLYFFRKKWFLYIFPILLVAFIRLHVLFFILLAFGFTQLFLNKRLKLFYKIAASFFLLIALYFLFPFLMARVGFTETESLIAQFEALETTKVEGGTSIDMSNQNLLVKWLSYMFRPLFFDANSPLLLISSVENSLWVLIFLNIFRRIRTKINYLYKSFFWFSFLSIFTLSIPSAYILINLGIAVRQKTMVFPFIIIVFFILMNSYKSNLANAKIK